MENFPSLRWQDTKKHPFYEKKTGQWPEFIPIPHKSIHIGDNLQGPAKRPPVPFPIRCKKRRTAEAEYGPQPKTGRGEKNALFPILCGKFPRGVGAGGADGRLFPGK